MKIVKELVEHIYSEIDAAECYVKAACKTDDQSLKALYIELAEAELNHVDRLHTKAKGAIDRARAVAGVAIPPGMREIWEWEHERVIAKVAKIKAKLDAAKAM